MTSRFFSRNFIQVTIEKKLKEALQPKYLQVINESHKHAVPKGSETHFKIVIVSRKFDNMSLLHRHRLVTNVLSLELENYVHALSIQAETESQWEAAATVLPTPPCLK